MSVYLMAQIHIHDRERYARYEAGFIEVLNDHDGTLVVVDDAATVIEGDWPFNRSVLVRFETEVAALGWYNSDAYQRLLEHRLAASVGNIVLVRGLGEKGK
jgi:uncharacterized protein (DUF1330 family)